MAPSESPVNYFGANLYLSRHFVGCVMEFVGPIGDCTLRHVPYACLTVPVEVVALVVEIFFRNQITLYWFRLTQIFEKAIRNNDSTHN